VLDRGRAGPEHGTSGWIEVGGAVLGERRDGIRPGGGTQEAQRLTRQVVVVADQCPVAPVGEHPLPGGAASTLGAIGLTSLEETLVLQGVDVAAQRGLGETQSGDEGRDADRPLLAHDTQHPVAGTRLDDLRLGINHTAMLGNYRRSVQGRVA
jgi:hypothetical protein